MKKKKRKLEPEWTDRKIHFGCEKRSTKRYCLHAWHNLIGDAHGELATLSHDYAYTDAGWNKTMTQAREYVTKGYTVSITQTGGL